jgi:hypothetical protein
VKRPPISQIPMARRLSFNQRHIILFLQLRTTSTPSDKFHCDSVGTTSTSSEIFPVFYSLLSAFCFLLPELAIGYPAIGYFPTPLPALGGERARVRGPRSPSSLFSISARERLSICPGQFPSGGGSCTRSGRVFTNVIRAITVPCKNPPASVFSPPSSWGRVLSRCAARNLQTRSSAFQNWPSAIPIF